MWQVFVFRGDSHGVLTFMNEMDAKKHFDHVSSLVDVLAAIIYGPEGFDNGYAAWAEGDGKS